MLDELLKILEFIIEMIIPIGLIFFILYFIFDVFIKKNKFNLKKIICLNILLPTTTLFLLLSMTFHVIQMGIIWEYYGEQHVLEPWMKTLSFITIESTYTIIFILMLFLFLYIYNHQIIPTNIKEYFKKLKIKKEEKL